MFRLHNQRLRARFTLIELLIVISIIGIITVLILPIFGNMEGQAKTAASGYNAVGVRRFLEMYSAKNGGYPESLHNGLCDNGTDFVKKVDINGTETTDYAMPNTLLQNMKNGTRELKSDEEEGGKFRQSLYAAGLKNVMTGFNGHSSYDGTDKYNNVTKSAPLHCINGDWFSAFTQSYDEAYNRIYTGDAQAVVSVKGKRLNNWVKNTFSENGDEDASWCRLVVLFVTETSLMASGTDLTDPNRMTLGGAPISPYAAKGEFAYYAVVFYAFANGNPAYVYTIISPEGVATDATAY